MRKNLSLLGFALSLCFCITACGGTSKPADSENSKENSIKGNNYSNTLYDWQELYEKAKFEKFKEPASINGLDGTLISVKGTVVSKEPESQSDAGEQIETFIISDYQDNEWVYTCISNTESLPEDGDEIIAYGLYLGAAGAYSDRPCCTLIRYINTSNTESVHNITTKGILNYDTFEKNAAQRQGEKVISSDFSSTTNVNRSFSSLTFDAPSAWSQTNSDGGTADYYYPPSGQNNDIVESLFVVQYEEAPSTPSSPEDLAQASIDGISKGDNLNIVSTENYAVCGIEGKKADFTQVIDSIKYNGTTVCFVYNDKIYSFSMLVSENLLVDYEEDFDKIISSIQKEYDPTPIAEEAQAPITEPNIYEGSGDSVIDIVAPEGNNDIFILYVKGNAESRHFAVKGYDSDSNKTQLFVNTTDPYEGKTIDSSLKTVQLEITASGDWYIEARSLFACPKITPSSLVESVGDEVLLVSGEPNTARISGNASGRHFAVKAHGSTSDLLVNTTDPYEGTTKIKSDTFILEVKAEGGWQINLE